MITIDLEVIISLYKPGDTDTPSVALGYFNYLKVSNRGMVSLPTGIYRIVFSVHGSGYGYVRLRDILVMEGVCSGEGKPVWCKM